MPPPARPCYWRGELVGEAEYPPERDISEEEPRIGVFVCHCGSNIAGFVDVESVEAYAATLPYVTHAERNLYTCSQDSITHITEQIEEHGLNRVIVAACTPLTHEPLISAISAPGFTPMIGRALLPRRAIWCVWPWREQPGCSPCRGSAFRCRNAPW